MSVLQVHAGVAAALLALAVLVWPAGTRRSGYRPGWSRLARRGREARRSASAPVGAADVMEHLALALSAGAPVVTALRRVAQVLPPAEGRALAAVAAALEWGLPDSVAWAEAPAEWQPARRALQLAQHAGVPPAGLLAAAAADLRRDVLAAVEVGTARLAVRLVLPLGLAFLPAFVLTTVIPLVLALAGRLAVLP